MKWGKESDAGEFGNVIWGLFWEEENKNQKRNMLLFTRGVEDGLKNKNKNQKRMNIGILLRNYLKI